MSTSETRAIRQEPDDVTQSPQSIAQELVADRKG
jgi:hypothetical protein